MKCLNSKAKREIKDVVKLGIYIFILVISALLISLSLIYLLANEETRETMNTGVYMAGFTIIGIIAIYLLYRFYNYIKNNLEDCRKE